VRSALKKLLVGYGHVCRTVQEAGWAGKQNGELLKLAETAFDVLVTLDTNLRYQQNLAGRTISIVVLQSSSNRLDHPANFSPPAFRPLRKSIPAKSFELATVPEKSDSEPTTYLYFNDC
jgi:hypothetical protein